MKPAFQRWTRRECAELERLWRSNVSANTIGKSLDRSRSSVLGKLSRMGLLCIERDRRKSRDQQIVARYIDGETARDLSAVFRLHPAYITQLARDHGYNRGAGRPRHISKRAAA
ncbi:GcrA family cell cycle regulator [Allopontixanthobacter sediminis]|uniref:GcrA cell cycle regulator n=1 Tax=Allopontixanthobacter sediminis TaxID=1689985 RepID=A0A845AYK9_9SPHN|nr:GcrA family cell cycle regulator [Allopontixanthobacter sediminis]MXP42964.1 hypothetical protein [Allopontixanthobacter sediminis]